MPFAAATHPLFAAADGAHQCAREGRLPRHWPGGDRWS